MTSESSAEELATLIRQTREHVAYLQELGVAAIKLETAVPLVVPQASAPVVLQTPTLDIPQRESSGTSIHSGKPVSAPVSLFEDASKPADLLVQSEETMEQIWAELKDCTRCPLHEGRTNIVHTEGNQRARLMFVGEAPGADEDAQARPFVGRAGQLRTKIIEAIGFKREDVLIGNVNRCRPPGNRAPLPDEAATCKPFLLREIASVQPEVIVVLGNTAMRNLLDTKIGITRLRGEFQDFRGIKVMPTFHPAYLLRDPSKKRETWEDLKKVRDYLDSTARREI
jgi:uracil-DNA glycosylase family 4